MIANMQHLSHHRAAGWMGSRRLTYGMALMLCALLLATAAHADSKREECGVCGMWIDLYMKTRHVVTLDDRTQESFCSIACASKYIRQMGTRVAGVMATDFNTKELMDAYSAFYLSGSDVPGVMTYTSRIAFSTRQAAEAFQGEHGGSIITFEQALVELDE